jgi:predicted DsbA family dithiol-disulfide isomerase
MIELQIWGDFECPFSYLQTIVLLKLKEKYKERIVIDWRSVEMNTRENFTTPSEEYIKNLEIASKEFIAQENHISFFKPKTLPNIRLAQESIHYANTQLKSLEMANAIFNAFFNHGIDISDQDEILDIGKSIDLDTKELNKALDDALFTEQVLLDEKEFKTLGFPAIPAMMIGEKDFSPRSFMPVVGYTTYSELDQIISKIQ